MGGVPELCKIFCPTVFSFTAIITAMLFGFWCRSFRYKANDVVLDQADLVDPGFGLPQNINLTNATVELQDLHFGPWYQLKIEVTDWDIDREDQVLTVYTRDNCVEWRDVNVDSELKLARAASVISVVTGAVLTTCICFTPCFVRTMAKLWKFMALGFILICTLFQGLTFMVLKSDACETDLFQARLENDYPNSTLISQNVSSSFYDDECSWDEGSSANVVAIVCWFICGCLMLVLGDPKEEDYFQEPQRSKEAGDGDENAEEVEEADKEQAGGKEGEEEKPQDDAEENDGEADAEKEQEPEVQVEETGGNGGGGGEGGDDGNLRKSQSLASGKF